ncbi:unnamed protein product [Somion occarium]|uniref:Uncharacterized protein n=1 Tax=Somion occarium TaxID=3059160 RepID=A0ABP1DFX9_9APHY
MAQQFAAPNGLWILRKDAQKQYNLAPSDLDGIRPISQEENPHGGPHDMFRYNVIDVQALVQCIQVYADPSTGPNDLAPRNGLRILHMRALETYSLQPCQLDRIKLISIETNPHNHNAAPMRYYNLNGVQALSLRITHAAENPV